MLMLHVFGPYLLFELLKKLGIFKVVSNTILKFFEIETLLATIWVTAITNY